MDARKPCGQCGERLELTRVDDVIAERCLTCGAFDPKHTDLRCARCHRLLILKPEAVYAKPIHCKPCAAERKAEAAAVLAPVAPGADSESIDPFEVAEVVGGVASLVLDLLDDD